MCATLQERVSIIGAHRPPLLRGWSFGEVLGNSELQRDAMLGYFVLGGTSEPDDARTADPGARRHRPGEGKRSALIGAREQAAARLIESWAVRSSLETARAATRSDAPDVRRPTGHLGLLTPFDSPTRSSSALVRLT
jgi:hypothetical protein